MQANPWPDRSPGTLIPRQIRMAGQAIDTGTKTKEPGQGPSHQSPGPSRPTLASGISTAINRNGRYRNTDNSTYKQKQKHITTPNNSVLIFIFLPSKSTASYNFLVYIPCKSSSFLISEALYSYLKLFFKYNY